ncbi:MAG: hypothetical protein ACFFDU_00025 [Candidatus Thorarchaeota archaeon]
MSFLYPHAKRSTLLLPILVAIVMISYYIALVYILTFLVPIIPGLIELPLSSIFRYFIIPVVFAFPWILFVYIFRERTINASEIMNMKGNLIPLRWRMLYSFNTLIILAFFIFPFASPPLAIFAALVLAYRIVHQSDNIWQKTQGARLGYTLILFILLALVPIYLTIVWFQYFLSIAWVIFTAWWVLFDPMYFTSLCIVNALAIGSLLHLSYGTLDESGKLHHTESQKLWVIRFAELVLFIVFWVVLNPFIPFFSLSISSGSTFNLAFPDPVGFAGTLGNISFVNYACLGIIAIVYLVKFAVGIGGDLKLSIIGILFVSAFLIVEALNGLFSVSAVWLRPTLMVGSSLIFILAFTISFFAASDELMEPTETLIEETNSLEKQVLEDAESIEEQDENEDS